MDPLTLAIVGAAYGTSIAWGLSHQARSRHSLPEAFLASLVACCVAAIGTIALQHRFDVLSAMLERIEYVASLSVGPLLLLYVRACCGIEPVRRSALHFLPGVGALLLPAASGDPLLGLPIQLVMLHQMSYTAAAIHSRLRTANGVMRHRRLSAHLLVFMILIHLAQIVRFLWNDVGVLRDIVPVTLSLLLLVAGARLLVGTIRNLSLKDARIPLERVAPAVDESVSSSPILERLERLMNAEHLYRDPDLTLAVLAERIGETPHRLSAALNEQAGVSLTDYLAQKRLEDARRRLLDPGHDIYTIEGIAGMSGFGSRSSFYSIFRRETGMTPAAFRKKECGDRS